MCAVRAELHLGVAGAVFRQRNNVAVAAAEAASAERAQRRHDFVVVRVRGSIRGDANGGLREVDGGSDVLAGGRKANDARQLHTRCSGRVTTGAGWRGGATTKGTFPALRRTKLLSSERHAIINIFFLLNFFFFLAISISAPASPARLLIRHLVFPAGRT